MQREFERQREQAQTRFATQAELRATQVENWLAQLVARAKFLWSGQVFADQFVAWVERGEQTAGDRLMGRLVEFRRGNKIEGVLLAAGCWLLAAGSGQLMAHEQPVDRLLDDILLQAVREAAASGAPLRTSIYRRKVAETPLRLNMVVPLVHTGMPARRRASARRVRAAYRPAPRAVSHAGRLADAQHQWRDRAVAGHG